jgi:hypothetical protein
VGFCVIDMMHKATYFLPDDQSPAGGRIPDGARNVPRVWPRRQPAQVKFVRGAGGEAPAFKQPT